MWIAKLKLKHDCFMGNRCKKFNVTAQSIALSVFEQDGKKIISSMHHMSGNIKNIDRFINDLKKDKNVLELERKKDTIFLLDKAVKGSNFYNPKIIFVKPVLVYPNGYEIWELGSWEKKELSEFINKVKTITIDFKILKFRKNNDIESIFFPRLMPNLTKKQKRAIELAIEKGYYQTPRKTNLRDLAKIMDISLGAYQKHLRIAEKKIMPTLISYFE